MSEVVVHHERDAAIVALEAVAARAWPAAESRRLGPWLLRAASGWTGRANSALPLQRTPDLTAWLPAIEAWYLERRLHPTVAVPTPTFTDLEHHLYAAGWQAGHGGDVMVAPVDRVLALREVTGPVFEVDDEPDADWLDAYHYRGGPLPEVALPILRGGTPRFARLRLAGETVAICRLAVEDRWCGIAAMEVAPQQRRRGLGRTLLRRVAAAVVTDGVRDLWLQVDPDNHAARAMYGSAGFSRHHGYRYIRATVPGPAPDG
ncbi:MAG TPA: GNAT family N-acetyltransferase [Egicoccus sp.]|nr:GNAT family N-acetyltransferase [Egicoccus sp.]HSK23512.1 GNAT family N-acetyltransferase [Egicoccus sp.]